MNIFLYSHHMSAWYCIDIERRFSVLIIQGSKNLRVYIRGKRPKKVNLIQVYCVIMWLGVLPLLLVGRLIHLQISPLHFNRFSYQFYLLQSSLPQNTHPTWNQSQHDPASYTPRPESSTINIGYEEIFVLLDDYVSWLLYCLFQIHSELPENKVFS